MEKDDVIIPNVFSDCIHTIDAYSPGATKHVKHMSLRCCRFTKTYYVLIGTNKIERLEDDLVPCRSELLTLLNYDLQEHSPLYTGDNVSIGDMDKEDEYIKTFRLWDLRKKDDKTKNDDESTLTPEEKYRIEVEVRMRLELELTGKLPDLNAPKKPRKLKPIPKIPLTQMRENHD